jgi:flagellar protein FliS
MVETASRARLVVLLYQGLLRFTRQAIQAVEQGDHEAANANFLRSQDIIMELAASLDMERGGEISRNLLSLYVFGYQQLMHANCSKIVGPADEVIRLFGELLEVWDEIALRSADQEEAQLLAQREAGVN